MANSFWGFFNETDADLSGKYRYGQNLKKLQDWISCLKIRL